jgi:hypothetical protein
VEKVCSANAVKAAQIAVTFPIWRVWIVVRVIDEERLLAGIVNDPCDALRVQLGQSSERCLREEFLFTVKELWRVCEVARHPLVVVEALLQWMEVRGIPTI